MNESSMNVDSRMEEDPSAGSTAKMTQSSSEIELQSFVTSSSSPNLTATTTASPSAPTMQNMQELQEFSLPNQKKKMMTMMKQNSNSNNNSNKGWKLTIPAPTYYSPCQNYDSHSIEIHGGYNDNLTTVGPFVKLPSLIRNNNDNGGKNKRNLTASHMSGTTTTNRNDMFVDSPTRTTKKFNVSSIINYILSRILLEQITLTTIFSLLIYVENVQSIFIITINNTTTSSMDICSTKYYYQLENIIPIPTYHYLQKIHSLYPRLYQSKHLCRLFKSSSQSFLLS